jgi:pimeloyl-ACP methyl ester carboxylesterase
MAQEATPAASAPLTVVLVHGAFADGGSWSRVISSLLKSGIPVIAPANPLRGIAKDSAYLQSVIAGIPGPVLLAAHSYGGAVITNAGTAPNVAGLVYVAAFAPDEGEVLGATLSQFPATPFQPALRPASVPATEADLELYIDPAQFPSIFAADLPAEETAWLALTQRPGIAAAFVAEQSGPAAWKNLPSWYVVATADQVIGVEPLRFYAERAGSTVTEVDASHAITLSQPEAVADVIRAAYTALS